MNVPSVKVKSDSLNSIFKTFKEITHLGNDTMTNLDSILNCYFADKGLSSQSYEFSSSHVWM